MSCTNKRMFEVFFIKSNICNNDIYLFFLFLFQLRITLEVTLCTFSMSMSDDRAVTATFNNWLACSLQLQRSLWICAIYFKLLIFIDFWAFANPGTSGTSTIAIKLLIFFSLSLALSFCLSLPLWVCLPLTPSIPLICSKNIIFFFVFRVKTKEKQIRHLRQFLHRRLSATVSHSDEVFDFEKSSKYFNVSSQYLQNPISVKKNLICMYYSRKLLLQRWW